MTIEELRDLAHAHGHHLAAFCLEHYPFAEGMEREMLDDHYTELTRLYWTERRFTDSDGIVMSGDRVIYDGYEEANRQPDQRRLGRWLMKAGTVQHITVDLAANAPKPFKTKADIDRAQRRVKRMLAKARRERKARKAAQVTA